MRKLIVLRTFLWNINLLFSLNFRAPAQGVMNIRRSDGWPTFNTKKDQSKIVF
jgi:hypothetical protein